jgi:SRSO17 transposase
LASVRGRLEAFVDELFDGAAQRSEQRKWGGVYLRGLMLDGKRKSIEPMAARLPTVMSRACSSSSISRRGGGSRSASGWRGG